MSANVSELQDRIKKLEATVEALTARCDELEWRVVKLVFSKLSNPRYPYWDWLLMAQMPEQTRIKLTVLLSELNGRVTDSQLPEEYHKDIDGVPRDLLYGSSPPPVQEVLAAIKTITGMQHTAQVLEMFRAARAQGMFSDLCDHVLHTLDA